MKFRLSDNAINFIKKYAIPYFNINTKIDEDLLDEILDIATLWECDNIDKNGEDKEEAYLLKERNLLAQDFVSELTGQWDDENDILPDIEDLNNRL